MLERKIVALIVGYFEPGAMADRVERPRAEFATIEQSQGKKLVIENVEMREEITKPAVEMNVQNIEETDKNHSTMAPDGTISPTRTPHP